MNSLERNAADAIKEVLETDVVLAAVPPRVWDSTEEPTMPSLVIKTTQGAELVYRHGVYRIAVEITAEGRAKDDVVDDLKARVTRLLLDDLVAHTELTTDHFHCNATEPGGSSISNSGDKRIMSVKLDLVGYDLDRHAA